MRLSVAVALAALATALTACSDGSWYGAAEGPPLPGDRVPVLLLDQELTADPRIAHIEVRLPPPQVNEAWPQEGGDQRHVMSHLAMGDDLELAWSVEIGEGSEDQGQLLARPVVADGRIFVMDSYGAVSTYNAESGELIWRRSSKDLNLHKDVFGGGLAFEGGWLFTTFTSGQVIGLDATDGREIWRQDLQLPVRAAPTVAEGVLLVVTADNQVYALNGETGQPVWRHAGFFETAGLLGGPSPAVDEGVAIVPYSSAEVFALRLDNGRPLWNDTLQRPRRTQALDQITDIDGVPVIDGEEVIVGGQGGQVASLDMRQGIRNWDVDLVAADTPWVAGDFIYVLTDRNEVVCLVRANGRIRWVTPLPRRIDETNAASPSLTWRGPLLVGDRLLLTSSAGQAVTVSPYTGEQLGKMGLTGPVHTAPVVAERTVYFLTENAELLAFR